MIRSRFEKETSNKNVRFNFKFQVILIVISLLSLWLICIHELMDSTIRIADVKIFTGQTTRAVCFIKQFLQARKYYKCMNFSSRYIYNISFATILTHYLVCFDNNTSTLPSWGYSNRRDDEHRHAAKSTRS